MPQYDKTFLSLMKNTCVIVKGSRPVSGTTGAYGHRPNTNVDGGFFVPAIEYPIGKCYFRPLSAEERAMTGRDGQIVDMFYLYLPVQFVPETLKGPSSASTHQVRDVTRKGGQVIDEGPFDIDGVQEPAGQNHHWLLSLKRMA